MTQQKYYINHYTYEGDQYSNHCDTGKEMLVYVASLVSDGIKFEDIKVWEAVKLECNTEVKVRE